MKKEWKEPKLGLLDIKETMLHSHGSQRDFLGIGRKEGPGDGGGGEPDPTPIGS